VKTSARIIIGIVILLFASILLPRSASRIVAPDAEANQIVPTPTLPPILPKDPKPKPPKEPEPPESPLPGGGGGGDDGGGDDGGGDD